MKHRLLFALLSLFYVVTIAQNKPGSQEVGFARHAAEEYLVTRGADPNKIELSLEEYTDHLLFFNDLRNSNFILMAREEFAPLLNDQVLAFSIGARHGRAKEVITFMTMISYYDNLLKDMQSGKEPKEQPFDVEPLRIKPLIYDIRWCQHQLKNVYEGQSGTVYSGCGAVALGQLMKGYQWPNVATGSYCYKMFDGTVISVNMDSTKIDWDKIHPMYERSDGEQKSLEPFIKMLGKALHAQYGRQGTSTNSDLYERTMTQHFGYSPAMCLIENMDVTESTMIHLVREELKARRPCILSGGRHAFVCDGAYDDFLHLNMGWSGAFDGWYRFPVVRKSVNPNSFIQSALINIMPLRESGISKSVTVEKPGTLSSLLTEDECAHITSLKVSGKLNGGDICLLRRMAGVVDSTNCFSWKGMLQKLDMSDAMIVSDTVPYATFNASRIKYRIMAKRKQYDFRKMTDSDWQSFRETHMDSTLMHIVYRQDTTYYVKFMTLNNTISMRMFANCENLQQIVLPRNLTRMEDSSFSDCHCLDNVVIPSGVPFLRYGCFSFCYSLQNVKVCSDSPILAMRDSADQQLFNSVFYYHNPNLKMTVDESLETYASAKERINAEMKAIRLKERGVSRKPVRKDSSGKEESSEKSSESKFPLDEYQKAMFEGKQVISHYKMVNGKKVLVSKEIKE